MKKPFENKTNSPMYVNGQMIPPGEICVVEVPDEHLPVAEVAAPLTLADQVELLLKGNVATIVAGLPELNSDALTMMAALEDQKPKPRSSLLLAIADAQIKLADDKLKGDDLSDPDAGGNAGSDAKPGAGDAK